jgi:hypothetical protein
LEVRWCEYAHFAAPSSPPKKIAAQLQVLVRGPVNRSVQPERLARSTDGNKGESK